VAAGAALLATGWLIGLVTRDGPPPSSAFRVSLRIPSDHRLTGIPVLGLALSPDGRTVVYSGESQQGLQLYARRLDELAPSPIAGTQGGYNPLFSSDGRSLAFTNGVQLRRVGLSGGAPLTVPSLPGVGFFAFHWEAADAFVASGPAGELGRLRPDGTFEVVARADSTRGEIALVPVTLLPDGAILAIAFSQGTAGPLFAVDGRTGARTPVSETVVSGAIYHDGVLAWVLPSGQLVATPFDLRRKAVSGTSVTLAENVRVLPGALPQIVASPSGDLAYVPSQPSDVVRVDRSGRLEVLTPQPGRYHNPRVSPDGRRIAVDNSGQTRDVWLLDLGDDRTMSRLSFENDGHDPMWMPDGRTVLYAHSSGTAIGIFRRRADGTGAAESLLVHGLQLTAHTASPGGDQVVAAGFGANGTFDLFAVNLRGERQASPVLVTPFNDAYPALSPDGRWLAYSSDESGRSEVYVRPFPGGGAKVLVSANGGSEPVWSRNGRELYYRDGEPRLIAATVGPGTEFRVTGREPLFEVADYETSTPHANYDVTPDGRFIFVRQGRLSEIVYIQNWTALVTRENPVR
jgi:serine/threonine-protein kinase